MKKELPPRYEEVLTCLRDNQDGRTTHQIFTWSKAQKFTELKDTTMISYIVYALRNKKMLTSDQTVGGVVHRITKGGIDALSEVGNDDELPVKTYPLSAISENESDPAQQDKPVTASLQNLEKMIDAIDIVDQFDESVAIIRSAIVESLSGKKLKIAMKDEKIAVLEKLEPLFSEDIADCLKSIRCDLLQCEG